MPFGLVIGTERATALQVAIQNELTTRGFSPDADPVMAEYITIMIINNKTAAQITGELEDLIGADYDPSFTDWLFVEAAKGTPVEPDAIAPSQPTIVPDSQPVASEPPPTTPTESSAARRPPNAPRNGSGLYQQALSQAIPSGPSTSGQKRTASARSPSPNNALPNKSRRMDLPTGPRAMYRDGPRDGPSQSGKSLLDRVGGPAGPVRKGYARDDIQARIDNITNTSPDMMMPLGGYPMNGIGPMEMNAMTNPLMLQEMMMNQMAMMAQMASSMGMLNPSTGQFVPPGFQGGDMQMYPGGFQGTPPLTSTPPAAPGNRRGGRGGGRGTGRGRGGAPHGTHSVPSEPSSNGVPTPSANVSAAVPIVAPTPVAPAPTTVDTAAVPNPAFVPPERPQSPTLCKFGVKCTNALCRYSHPSPVATTESGVVLSNEPCENGKNCKDKDCVKSHVSPAVLTGGSEPPRPKPHVPSTAAPSPAAALQIPCRFGASCSRPDCPYIHTSPASAHHKSANGHFAQQCRFGAGCTRASCGYQHPEGRVLPSTFHRGLSTTSPVVSVPAVQPGSIGGPATSQNRSMTFKKPAEKEKAELLLKMQELEEKKKQIEKVMGEKEAKAAANAEKREVEKLVSISA